MNMSRQINEMESDRDQTKNRILQLQKFLADCEEGMFYFFLLVHLFGNQGKLYLLLIPMWHSCLLAREEFIGVISTMTVMKPPTLF